MSRARREARRGAPGEAGFTLLEVLAAVAIAGFVLSAIGSIVAVTLAGVRSTAERVALTAIGRTLLDSLPQGDQLRAGTTTGTAGTARWRIDVTALPERDPVRRQETAVVPSGWAPAAIAIVARARSGRSLRLDTIGLIQSGPRRGPEP